MSRLLSIACVVMLGIGPGLVSVRSQATKNSSTPTLTAEERALMTASRRAIVQTGVSEAYFEQHFTLVNVVNKPGDRRIVWKFRVNEYETFVSDVLGFYTKDGKRVDIHSVATTLHSTTEIIKTISRKSAIQKMQRCIGKFANPLVEYRRSGDGPAELVFSAESIPKISRKETRARREREEREARERAAAKSQVKKDMDEVENEGDEDHPPIFTGSINLQTGKCVKGQLISTP